ncbi:hypothetical protein BDV37DRAFT_256217 [Aspergillus pseudonomiae]|uniref:Uncharacterized protein n=1 Tax=Aspergillus pseudonomiae TaxID=1506151 RepID=A0A5N7D3J3_9EURO|nr:uncharacterized protein BDV37DRAFT_256217 [Aspergillus pseudonomiae]KAE8400982.1 hypothetical protein BDV37DRAFT_256217 [Aspergillus pseudonomiae]
MKLLCILTFRPTTMAMIIVCDESWCCIIQEASMTCARRWTDLLDAIEQALTETAPSDEQRQVEGIAIINALSNGHLIF